MTYRSERRAEPCSWRVARGWTFSLILLMGMGIYGCGVSRDVYTLKSQEADQLTADLKITKGKLHEAETTVSEQILTIESLTRENKDCQARVKELDALLEKKAATQGKMIEDLLDQNQKLSGELNIYRLKTEEREQKVRELTETIRRSEARKEKEILEIRSIYAGLTNQLREQIDRGAIQVRELSDRVSIHIAEKTLFESGKAEIKPAAVQLLEKVGKVFQTISQEKRVQVGGHSDNVPIVGQLARKYPTNWELSAARALSVVRFLHERLGIDGSVLSAAAYAEFQPLASNETDVGRSLNRRIEIVVK